MVKYTITRHRATKARKIVLLCKTVNGIDADVAFACGIIEMMKTLLDVIPSDNVEWFVRDEDAGGTWEPLFDGENDAANSLAPHRAIKCFLDRGEGTRGGEVFCVPTSKLSARVKR